MIEANNDKSYLGKEIREWCMNNPEDNMAQNIMNKYYSDHVEFKPSDKIYYFIDYISATQSFREYGSLYMYGYSLHRDLEKSPRKANVNHNTKTEGKNHKSCYGNYIDKDGNICEEGSSGLCNYCTECCRDCIYTG